jgi:cyclic pyranopterin monophosphate synthase
MNQPFTHLNAEGHARMVDVADKDVTARSATARSRVSLSAETVAALRDGTVPKGDALGVARIAAIQATKRTPDLIPLCHPIAVHGVDVDLELDDSGVTCTVTVRTADRTGVEMEALTAAAVGGLALIDMVKGMDRMASIEAVQVIEKRGGRSGTWTRP